MCEFCKNGKRDIILNDDGSIICLTADAVVAIDRDTGKKHKNQIAINYCPICGRKLVQLMAEPLSKLAEKCKSCPKSEKCDHKRMELCALMDLPPQNLASATQGILIDNMSTILREEIKSPLSPFRYKDELEKALNERIYKQLFTYGSQKVGERMIKEALLDISKGYVKVFFDGNPVDSIYSVDGITDDESGMKKIQLTFLVKEVLFKE